MKIFKYDRVLDPKKIILDYKEVILHIKSLLVVNGVVSSTLRPKLSVAETCGGLGVVEDLKMMTGFKSLSF